MKNASIPHHVALVAAVSMSCVSMVQAAVIYHEPFHNTDDQEPISNVGWEFARSDGNTTSNTSDQQAGRLSDGIGVDGQPGFAYNYFNDGPIAILTWWDDAGQLSQPQSSDLHLSTWVGTNQDDATLRFALRIGSGEQQQWYITRAPVANNVGDAENFQSDAVEMMVDYDPMDDETWALLDFDGDGTAGFTNWTGQSDLPDAVALSPGDITAWGIYASHEDNFTATRYDQFTVVPEPASLALLGLGSLLMLGQRRQSRA